jgi:hypothetical protein
MKNYDIWKKKLKHTKDVSFLLYPKLNHITMEGENPSRDIMNTIKKEIFPTLQVRDIADWLKHN